MGRSMINSRRAPQNQGPAGQAKTTARRSKVREIGIQAHNLEGSGSWFGIRDCDQTWHSQPIAVLTNMGWADVIVGPAKSSQHKRTVVLGQAILCPIMSIKLASPKSHI